ncbi:hypothetical protein ECE50_029750 [Chitinophaga sp. Mgbs1]|uniref:Uncharacterized protein n=1 Tax=Chitinophaga solisilvae TaxID=1233460 RepID=A0A9Q5DAA6_9BACT|nr:hypothetical protein [Chitinophaga solisilvae]
MKVISLLFLSFLLTYRPVAAATEEPWQPLLKAQLQALEKATPSAWAPHVDTLAKLAGQYPDIWLLQYYAGWAYTQLSFKTPKKMSEVLCNQAEPFVRKALALQPGNTETLTLMGYWLSARINAVPSRGAALGAESRDYAQKAISADSSNPRAFLIKALNIYYTPAIFGGGKKRARAVVEETGAKFAAFTPADEFSPAWGKNIYEVLQASYK